LITVSPVSAQRSEMTLEASVFSGTLGYAWHIVPRLLVGIEAGLGIPQMNLALHPQSDPVAGEPYFGELLHIGVMVRTKAGDRFEIDAGARGAVADLWPCQASDCWPELFYGGYVQPMIGWRRIKFGARLSAGWVTEGEDGTSQGTTFAVGLAPLLVRFTFPR
jgi:hypothetical protein